MSDFHRYVELELFRWLLYCGLVPNVHVSQYVVVHRPSNVVCRYYVDCDQLVSIKSVAFSWSIVLASAY